ncbi:hypothetical protein SESBI_50698 [Sesbania bispinosa]|nr:hypothetical protein SESBI_50698 [Sesbania bispinosa]
MIADLLLNQGRQHTVVMVVAVGIWQVEVPHAAKDDDEAATPLGPGGAVVKTNEDEDGGVVGGTTARGFPGESD